MLGQYTRETTLSRLPDCIDRYPIYILRLAAQAA